MSIYAVAFIGIKPRKGRMRQYGFGYQNGDIPDIVISDDWKEKFINKKTREQMLTEVFIEDPFSHKNLRESIEELDYDGEYIEEFDKFMRGAMRLKPDEVESILFGISVGNYGQYKHEWKILNLDTGTIESKCWDSTDWDFPKELM